MPILVFGSITGIISGVVVWGFRWCASYIEGESSSIYSWFRANPTFIPLLFCGLIVLALLSTLMNKFIPELRTNSISNAEGAMRGMLKYKWPRTIFGTVASSFVSYLGGLTFGAQQQSRMEKIQHYGRSGGRICGSVWRSAFGVDVYA